MADEDGISAGGRTQVTPEQALVELCPASQINAVAANAIYLAHPSIHYSSRPARLDGSGAPVKALQ